MKNLLLCLIAFCSLPLFSAEWSLELVGAIASQRTLQVLLREQDGIVTHAFALAPTTKSPGVVDASALRYSQDTWSGSLKINFPSDGWNPPPGTTIQMEYHLQMDAKGSLQWQQNSGAERNEGTITVRALKPRTLNPALVSLTAFTANPLAPGDVLPKSHRAKNLQIRLALVDNAVNVAILREQASPVDTGNDIKVHRHDIRHSDGKWQGLLEAVVRHQTNRQPIPWQAQIEFVSIGEKIAGTLTVKNDTTETLFPLSGSLQAAATSPENAILLPMFLFGALPNGGNLECYLECKNSQIVTGFATGPNANNATHIIDAKNLHVSAGRFTGTMGVVLMADPWNPPDHLPRPMMIQIDAAVTASGSAVVGTFNGYRGSEAIEGTLAGLFQPSIAATTASKVMIKFEDGLLGAGDKSWFRRAFVGANLDANGKVTGGKISNNHSSLTGTTDSGYFLCPPGRLEGEVSISASAGNIQAGSYNFRFKGPRVGDMATGLFELLGSGNEVLKTGSFWASVDMKRGE